MFYSVFEKD